MPILSWRDGLFWCGRNTTKFDSFMLRFKLFDVSRTYNLCSYACYRDRFGENYNICVSIFRVSRYTLFQVLPSARRSYTKPENWRNFLCKHLEIPSLTLLLFFFMLTTHLICVRYNWLIRCEKGRDSKMQITSVLVWKNIDF